MAPSSLLFRNITMEELEEMSYRELQQRSKSLHLPANFKRMYLMRLIYEKINGREEQVSRIINQAKFERLQAATARKRKNQQFASTLVVPTTQTSPPLTVTPKKSSHIQPVKPITLNISERILRNRIECKKYNEDYVSNEGYHTSRVNQSDTPKCRIRMNGSRCAGLIVPRKIRKTGIPELTEQLKTLQPIVVTDKNRLHMFCKDKTSTMEIVLRAVSTSSTPTDVRNLDIEKNEHGIPQKKILLFSPATQEEKMDVVPMKNQSLLNNNNCNSQRDLNSRHDNSQKQSPIDRTNCNSQTTLSISYNDEHQNHNNSYTHNDGNRMDYSGINDYPNLRASFEEPAGVVSQRTSNCLTPAQARSLNEHTPICTNFINNNIDVVTPGTTRSFVTDYFCNLNIKHLDIYFNPRFVRTFNTNTERLNIINRNGIIYTGMKGFDVNPTNILPCRPITSTGVTDKGYSCCWNLQFLPPHDVMLYQPQDINRENIGILRNPLCILASQVTKIMEVEEDMDDALEVISQDGDYLSRLGMNVKVKCLFCSWESTKLQFDNHLRKEHSDLILTYNTVEWVISFNLEQIVNKEDWCSILVQDHVGLLYIVSGKLQKLDYLLISIATVAAEQDTKEVSITAYNRQTSEPCVWYGEVQDFTSIDMNDDSSHIRIELSRLDIVPRGLVHHQLIIYSPSEPLETNIVLYVKF